MSRKERLLGLAKRLGLFRAARRMTGSRLRVLCYHSFGVDDEASFRPGLFIHPQAFRERLDHLLRESYPVLALETAVRLWRESRLPACAVVITIDDGMIGVHRHAGAALAERALPATLYLTTHHHESRTPVFDVTIGYLLWKSEARSVEAGALPFRVDAPQADGRIRLDDQGRAAIERAAIEHGEGRSEDARVALARALARALEVDYDALAERRVFSIVDEREARELMTCGIDLQLHTHSHRFPVDARVAHEEIARNAEVITRLGAASPIHFCYPSGDWEPAHLPLLQAEGIRSATTCDPGLVTHSTHPLAMPRVLDSSRVSQLEFEAEMCGLLDLARDVRRLLSPRAWRARTPA